MSDYFWVDLKKSENGSWMWSTGYVQPAPGPYWGVGYPSPGHQVAHAYTVQGSMTFSLVTFWDVGGYTALVCQAPVT